MKVFIASDHAGFTLKKTLVAYLHEEGHEVIDMGAHALVPGDDYPHFILPCARKVAEINAAAAEYAPLPLAIGIVIGGSGQGEAMAANRIQNIRGAVFYGTIQAREAIDVSGTKANDAFDIVRLPRLHNDANVLSIGARFVTETEAKEAVRIFLSTEFSGDDRHERRIKQFNTQ